VTKRIVTDQTSLPTGYTKDYQIKSNIDQSSEKSSRYIENKKIKELNAGKAFINRY